MKLPHAFTGIFFCILFFAACQPSTQKSGTDLPFYLPDDLEITLWAASPMFYNPTNMDIDARGRVWVT